MPAPHLFACRLWLTAVLLVNILQLRADSLPLLPMPQQCKVGKGYAKATVPVTTQFVDSIPGACVQAEAYRLSIQRDRILIEAVTSQGVYWAQQTLAQLREAKARHNRLPLCEITDWPAFPIRGFMHDTGRSFIPIEELKREIALLSRFKINTFHWHLTENQAWRLACQRYPQLNADSITLRHPGQYYTQQEAAELVTFCKNHGVLLIPEIDMPGHSAAFERAFGCAMQSERGTQILRDILDEVCEVFDVPYLHIGTDEVAFTNPSFVPNMVAYVRSKGKKVISWNPGWNYKAGEVDMTQLWSYRGKPTPGVPAIDCRFHYANHFDMYADLVALYHSRIGNQTDCRNGIAGCIVAFWNDRRIDNPRQILADNSFYPYMLTLAERSWRGGGTSYFDGKATLLWPEEAAQLADFQAFEQRMLWHKDHLLATEPFPYVAQSEAHWFITEAYDNEGQLQTSFLPEQWQHDLHTLPVRINDTLYIYKDSLRLRPIIGNGIYLRHVWGTTVPAFYTQPQPNHTAYAIAWVKAKHPQKVGVMLETQNYSRSESDLPPPAGAWDERGSRIWINGKEIMAPHWDNTHHERNNELCLRYENAASRPPVVVTLQRGWNKIMLKLPVASFKSPATRLVKWMFTAALVEVPATGQAPIADHPQGLSLEYFY